MAASPANPYTPRRPAMPLPGSIRFEDWRGPIQLATTPDEVVRLAQAYCDTWSREQLDQLPWMLTANPIEDADSLVNTAVVASRAELKFDGSTTQHRFLREIALTLAAAASRLRALKTPDYQH